MFVTICIILVVITALSLAYIIYDRKKVDKENKVITVRERKVHRQGDKTNEEYINKLADSAINRKINGEGINKYEKGESK